MVNKTHYELLGISQNAPQSEVEAAYDKLTTQKSLSAEQMTAIEEAYQTLSDPAKRKEYNEGLSDSFDPADLYPIEDISHLSDDEPKKKTWKDTLWSITKIILIIIVTGGLLYYAFSKVPFAKVKFRIVHANYWWVAAGAAVFFISTIVSAWRLMSFFRSIGLKLNSRFNFRLYMLGMCYNVFLPGGIGGDGYKIYLLSKRYKLPAKKVFWAIFFDRLSGFWAIGLITVALIYFIPQIDINITIPLAIFLGGSGIYYFVAYKFFRDYTHNFFAAHAKAVVVQSLQVITIILVIIGQDFHGKYAPYLLSFLISSLAAVVPFSLGGGGAREGIFVKLAGVFHMMEDMALYLSVTFYLISLLIALFGSYYAFRLSKLEEDLPPTEEEAQKD